MKSPSIKDYYNSIIKKAKSQKNFLSLLSGNVISQIIPFLLAPIIARIFTPVDFAVQANFIALIMLISSVAAGRYEVIVLQKIGEARLSLPYHYIDDYRIYFSNVLLLLKDVVARLYNVTFTTIFMAC